MSRRVVVRPLADKDLEEQVEFIARNSPRAARRFYEAAENAFLLLASMPELGGVYESRTAPLAGLRSWPIEGFEKHLIFYRPTEEAIEIVRVLHGARDIDKSLAAGSDISNGS